MSGYNQNTDNLSSYITSGASSASLIFLGSDNVTGTYSTSSGGVKHTGGCMDSNYYSPWSSIMPSGTAGFKFQKIFTSSTSFTKKYSYYSDSSCSTSTGYIKYGYTNIIVNPAAVSVIAISPRPSSAYQVQYSKLNVISKGKTSAAVSFLNTFLGMTHSLDAEQTNSATGTIYNIWATAIISSSSWLYYGTESSSTYPTGWTQYDDISFK